MNIAFTTKKNGNNISFNNLSIAPNGTIWDWSFGDGSTSKEKSPTHTYGERGFFLVELTARIGTDDPINISSVVVISDKVSTTLPGSIYNLIDNRIPPSLLTQFNFNLKQNYIEKWQLFLQPLVDHNIALSDYNDELCYEALENQLIIELATYDYLVDYLNNYIFSYNQISTMDGEENKIVKKITTGPSEVEWFSPSDVSDEKLKVISKYFQPGGYLDLVKSNICDLASRLNLNLTLCKQKQHRVLPIIAKNENDRPFKGPNPSTGLN